MAKRKRKIEYIPDFVNGDGTIKIYAPAERRGLSRDQQDELKVNSVARFDGLFGKFQAKLKEVKEYILSAIDLWNSVPGQEVIIVLKPWQNSIYNIYTDVTFMDSIVCYDAVLKKYFPISAILKKRFWRTRYYKINKAWPAKEASMEQLITATGVTQLFAQSILDPSKETKTYQLQSILIFLKKMQGMLSSLNSVLRRRSKFFNLQEEIAKRNKGKNNTKVQNQLRRLARRANLSSVYEYVTQTGVANLEDAIMQGTKETKEKMQQQLTKRAQNVDNAAQAAADLAKGLKANEAAKGFQENENQQGRKQVQQDQFYGPLMEEEQQLFQKQELPIRTLSDIQTILVQAPTPTSSAAAKKRNSQQTLLQLAESFRQGYSIIPLPSQGAVQSMIDYIKLTSGYANYLQSGPIIEELLQYATQKGYKPQGFKEK